MSRDRAPSSGWAARIDRIRWMGPGLVMAATAIGASHLVLAPTAGAAYGTTLLWLVVATHLFKYPAFDFGPRYAVATGTSLIDGYARVPGPRGWALWIFLAGTVVQGFSVLAGVLSVSAVVARAVVPALSVTQWSFVLGVVAAGLLYAGRFDGLSALSKAMLIVLATMTVIAFLATPPPASAWIDLVRPGIPDGSLLLVVAILGWMPTGIDVSVWHSLWALERREAWSERAHDRRSGTSADSTDPSGRVLTIARIDLGVGYGLSFVLGLLFLALGATVLRPTGTIPQGGEVAVAIARLYTDVLGEWALLPFLSAAFFGMFSSTLGVMDGFPRAFTATVARLRSEPGREEAWFWGFLLVSLALALIEIMALEDPVVLVTVAAVASFVLAPVTYALNTWCVTRQTEAPSLAPGPLLRSWALVGIVCMAVASGLFSWVQFVR